MNRLCLLEMGNGAALATTTRCAVASYCTDHKLRTAFRFQAKTYNAQQAKIIKYRYDSPIFGIRQGDIYQTIPEMHYATKRVQRRPFYKVDYLLAATLDRLQSLCILVHLEGHQAVCHVEGTACLTSTEARACVGSS